MVRALRFKSVIFVFAALLAVGILSSLHFKSKQSANASNIKDVKTIDLKLKDNPMHMTIDPEDKIWLTNFSPFTFNELVKYDPITKEAKHYKLLGESSTGFYSSLKADDKYVWAGFGNNIIKFNKEKEISEVINLPDVKYSVSEDKFLHDNFYPDKETSFSLIDMALVGKEIWISRLYANSITRYSITEGKFYEYKLASEFGVPDKLYIDKLGNIWMTVLLSGYNSGIDEPRVSNDRIGKYHMLTGKFEYYNQPAGYIAVDEQGSAWIRSPLDNTIVTIDANGKIAKNEFHKKDARGESMVIGKDGNPILASGSKLEKIDKKTKKLLGIYDLPIKVAKDISAFPDDISQDAEITPDYKDMQFDSRGNLWFLNGSYSQLGFVINSDLN